MDLSQLPHELINVPGDGNCFFSCLSLCLVGNTSKALHLRHMVCSNVARKWLLWVDTAKLHHGEGISLQQYEATMIRTYGYATACELMAAAAMYQTKIVVWLKNEFPRGTKGPAAAYTKCVYGEDYTHTIHLLLQRSSLWTVKLVRVQFYHIYLEQTFMTVFNLKAII